MTAPLDDHAARHRGPPLALLATAHVALFVASLVVLDGATEGSWPRPGALPEDVLAFITGNANPLRVVGLLQFGAAVPLLLYAATASSQLRHLGIRAAGTTITLAGGVVAATLLAVAGLGMVTAAATTDVASPAIAAVVHQLIFLVGGPGHVVFLGLLLAGIAVTSLLSRQLPRSLAGVMVAVAVLAEVSTLSLVIEPLGVLVAIGRFGGMATLFAAGALLPTRRPASSGMSPATTRPAGGRDE